jgi:hypothetical protein
LAATASNLKRTAYELGNFFAINKSIANSMAHVSQTFK